MNHSKAFFSESVEDDGELVSVDIVDCEMTKFIAVEQIPQKKPVFVEVSLQLFNGLDLQREGKHKEAVDLYFREACEGSEIACFNLGNCFTLGVGVELDIITGLSLWMSVGHVGDVVVELLKTLSNFKYLGKSEIDLSGLFFVVQCCYFISLFMMFNRV